MKTLAFMILIASFGAVASNENHETGDHKKTEHKEKGHQDSDHGEGEHREEGGHEAPDLPAGVVSFHDEEAEFTLRPNVVKNFSIASSPLKRVNGYLQIPATALVRSLDKTTIFTNDKDKFRSLPVKVISQEKDTFTVKPEGSFEEGSVVYQGTNFLQTILLSLEEGPSEGHGH